MQIKNETSANEKLIYIYMGLDRLKEDELTTYWLYDPATDKHYEIDKAKFEKLKRNAK